MSSFKFQSNLVIVVLLLYKVQKTDASNCKFEGYTALCNVYLGKDLMTKVTAVINHCHQPIDVTFIIKSQDQNVNWNYTFVNRNPPESRAIKGFNVPVLLSVDLKKKKEQIFVKADFNVNDYKNVPFLNNKIPINSCNSDMNSGRSSHVIIAIVLTLLLFAISGSVVGWICYRRKRSFGERVALVDDMEIETSQPSSSTSTSTIRLSDVRNSDCESPN